ncbi:MAG: hypothetical protein FJ387_03530 [Verrucomicrobia bacterium]|nr:hypothetical protein [Verrucomicrobiota bacterium]
MAAQKTQVHTTTLATLQPRLLAALGQSGFTAAELTEFFARRVSATCVQCGLRLTGEELSQVALASDADALADPKLARVRQGYCGRNGCDSYFYELAIERHHRVSWDAVLRALTAPATAEREPAVAEDTAAATAARAEARRKRLIRIGVGVGVLLVLLLVRHVMFGGRIPLLQSKPEYRVNPESVSQAEFVPVPTGAATNASRTNTAR